MPRGLNTYDQIKLGNRNNYSSLVTNKLEPNLQNNNLIVSGNSILTQPSDIVSDGILFYADWAIVNSYPNSGTNTIFDLSGAGINGIVNGTPTFRSEFSGIIDFNNNSNNYYNLGRSLDNLSSTSNFTVECFVRWRSFPSTGNSSSIVAGNVDAPTSLNGGFQLGFFAGYGTAFGTYGGGASLATSAFSASANVWYHLVGVKSSVSPGYRLYANNVLVASNSITTNGGVASQDLRIGNRTRDSSLSTFDGVLAFVRIYNKALSEQEIAQNFNAQRTRFGI